ncbi:MAG: TAT-variant-translocated molybdopterin oxidoreductase [bacterium]|nr:TAT-variant-translocated molybdopterin oxidoreductase [bacterium]
MSSLKQTTGKKYWRSMNELADRPEFRQFVEREFPAWADEMLSPASRRKFLKLMGASMALAGMTACRWPSEEILPFTRRPGGYVPGVPLQFATAMELGGSATGLLVTSYDGRPVKIEGNPQHPQSGGATNAWAQATLLELYDPDRSSSPSERDGENEADRSWAEAEAFLRSRFADLRGRGGRGFHVLSEASGSPTVADMRRRLQGAFPSMTWHEYETTSRDNQREGTRLAFGRPYRVHNAFDAASTIVSFDEDFLLHHPAAVRNARDFSRGRDVHEHSFSRLRVFESAFSVTGAAADHRVAVQSRMIPVLVACLAAELFLELGLQLPHQAESMRPTLERFRLHPLYTEFDFSFARELLEHPGQSLIVAGPRQPPEVHALVCFLNQALGNVGNSVTYVEAADENRPHHHRAIRDLAGLIERSDVDTLLVLGGNAAFDAPADLGLAALLQRVPASIHVSLYRNETSSACLWHLPRAHFLETWGDTTGDRGTLTVAQPLIEPLFNGKSVIEVLALVLGDTVTSGHDLVRRTFGERRGASGFEDAWQTALHDGVVAGTEWPAERPSLRDATWSDNLKPYLHAGTDEPEGQLELVFLEDSSVLDGRFANNGWLQEMPDPLTKLTWDNAALMSPATAEQLGVGQSDMIRVGTGDASVDLPVHVMPGVATGSIAVQLGYGRTRCGKVGEGAGFDVYPLRVGQGMSATLVTAEKIDGRYPLHATQDHYAIDALGAGERAERVHRLVKEVELEEFLHDPEHAMHGEHHLFEAKLWAEHEYEGHRWAMSIDLNSCIGCNACTIACQAENNIPVVGKDEIGLGREMHWIRIDRYFAGEPEDPDVVFQPVTCQHCENAPCEQVCPVAATVHDHEGLNVMVYNRCVGTRYCANNCPYKVRRFNYFNNHENEQAVQTMIYNPEVSIRSRGVMEKCTFCTQRIQNVKIQAKNEGRTIRDGEITTACEQACPTRAIVFGDLSDESSRVAQAHHDERAYTMLEELNIKPRTRYLARVRNRRHGEGVS